MLLQLLATATIELVTSSTAQIDYTWGAVDLDATSGIVMDDAVGGSGAISSATTTTVVDAPASNGRRQIKHLSLYNLGAAANTVRVQLDANGTNRVIRQWVLQPGESVLYTQERGFEYCASGGLPKREDNLATVDGRSYSVHKVGTAAEAAGIWYSWSKDTGNPSTWAPGTPGVAGRATDGTTTNDAGCIPIPNPSSGSNYVTGFDGLATVVGHIGLWDYLWVNSGLVVTTTTAQTVNSVAFPARDANGSSDGTGLEAFILVTTATTNAGAITNTTMSYTNQAGTAGRTGTIGSFPATAVAGTAAFFRLAAGDTGVRSIQSVTLGTSYGGGAISVVVGRSIMNRGDGIANVSTHGIAGIVDPKVGVRIYNGSCLVLMGVRSATTATNVFGNVYVATR